MHRKASAQRQSRANTGGALTDFTHASPRTLCGVNPLSTYKFGAILMAAKRGNLPIELSSFVGRRSEAKEVRRLLSDYRLVTLTGLGGVGKTRLALRAADDSSRAFPGASGSSTSANCGSRHFSIRRFLPHSEYKTDLRGHRDRY